MANISNSNNNSLVNGTSGNDSIYNYAASVTVDALSGNDDVYNSGDGIKSSLDGGAGDDTIQNYGKNVTILGGAGKDSVKNSKAQVTIDGGDDADRIINTAASVSIYGGEGEDTIIGNSGDDTLSGGTGNDTFIYTEGDGDDIITDYNASDVIRITGDSGIQLKNSGNNVVIEIGGNTITLQNAAEDNTTVTYYYNDKRYRYIPDMDGANDLLVDDNYSATAALSSIVEPVKAQYTPYDFDASFDLVKQPAFAPATAYSDKK